MTAHADDLRLALRLADVADAMTMARFRAADLVVETKPDLTPVSDADRAVEREVREVIGTERPGDPVVGEEYGADRATGNRRWIVDPIDGTKHYVRGVPVWATLIALEADGATAVGVVSAPALGRRWWAAPARGRVGPRPTELPRGRAGCLRWAGSPTRSCRTRVSTGRTARAGSPRCCPRYGEPARSVTSGRTCSWPKARSTRRSSRRSRCGTSRRFR